MPKTPNMYKCRVLDEQGREIRTIGPYGREGWALRNLYEAGDAGCTPIDHPGPRWSAYVHDLRHEFGLEIETVTESHDGDFPGHHARYILRSKVAPLSEGGEA